jgi:hypothetical protein
MNTKMRHDRSGRITPYTRWQFTAIIANRGSKGACLVTGHAPYKLPAPAKADNSNRTSRCHVVNRRLNVKFAICIRLIFKTAPFDNTITVLGKRDIWCNPVKQRGRNDNGCSLNHDLPRMTCPSSSIGSYLLKRVCWHEILSP